MTDDMTAKQVLAALAAFNTLPDSATKAEVRAAMEAVLIPKPPAPRFRMVDLDKAVDGGDERGVAYVTFDYRDLEAQPDVLVVIERVLRAYDEAYPVATPVADELLPLLTAALTEGGTQ